MKANLYQNSIPNLLQELNNLCSLEYESFGNDRDAYYELMEDKLNVLRQLRQLGWKPKGAR